MTAVILTGPLGLIIRAMAGSFAITSATLEVLKNQAASDCLKPKTYFKRNIFSYLLHDFLLHASLRSEI